MILDCLDFTLEVMVIDTQIKAIIIPNDVITMPADALAPDGARASASTVMTTN